MLHKNPLLAPCVADKSCGSRQRREWHEFLFCASEAATSSKRANRQMAVSVLRQQIEDDRWWLPHRSNETWPGQLFRLPDFFQFTGFTFSRFTFVWPTGPVSDLPGGVPPVWTRSADARPNYLGYLCVSGLASCNVASKCAHRQSVATGVFGQVREWRAFGFTCASFKGSHKRTAVPFIFLQALYLA